MYSFRHSVMWSPILIRHCLVCSSCSLSERPFSGLSSCFNAALTGLILSLHCKTETRNVLFQRKRKFWTMTHPLLWYAYTQAKTVLLQAKWNKRLAHSSSKSFTGFFRKKLYFESPRNLLLYESIRLYKIQISRM